MKTKRIEKLVSGMTSFSKEHYQKSELLNEMFALQTEIEQNRYAMACRGCGIAIFCFL